MMVRKIMMAVTLATLAAPDLAHADCTRQELMTKGMQLSQLVKAKMSTDPTRGRVLLAKMAPIMKASQVQMIRGGAVDLDKVCGEFDHLIMQAK
jgi:hypothetical protein